MTHRVFAPATLGSMRRYLLLAFALLIAGCAAAFDRVRHIEMAPRLSYQGFSFDKPANLQWFILKREESHTDVTLRQDLGSPTHSFYARVALSRLERQPATPEQFVALLKFEDNAPYPARELTHAQSSVRRQGQWCVRFDRVVSVVPPEVGELRMLMGGYRCLHPAFPQMTLDFFWTERGRPDELDPSLARDGDRFLEGVRIDVAPGQPAS